MDNYKNLHFDYCNFVRVYQRSDKYVVSLNYFVHANCRIIIILLVYYYILNYCGQRFK